MSRGDDRSEPQRREPAPVHLQATPPFPSAELPRWLFLFAGLAIGAIGAVVATTVGPSGAAPRPTDPSVVASDVPATTTTVAATTTMPPTTVAITVGPPSTPAGANDVERVTTTTAAPPPPPPPATAATTVAPETTEAAPPAT